MVDKNLLTPNNFIGTPNLNVTIPSSSFPETIFCCPIDPFTLFILVLKRTQEKPFWVIRFYQGTS